MVIYWSRFRKEVVFFERGQSTRNLGQYHGKDVGIRRKRMSNFPCCVLIVQRSNSKAKDMDNCRFTLLPLRQQLKLFFRIIVSAHQLSLCGAVANMFEECQSLDDRSGQLDKVMGQSIVLSQIKTEVPLENDDHPAYQIFLLQRFEEKIEILSQEDKVGKICLDAGSLSYVESGQ